MPVSSTRLEQHSISVAQIGAGYFGQIQAQAWNDIPRASLTALADKRGKYISLPANITENVSVYDDAEKILPNHQIDVLDIATPPAAHRELIIKFAGKVPHIICQKPFCRSLKEAQAVVNEVSGSGSTIIIHENFRFMPWFRRIGELIGSGVLGEVRQACFRLRPGDGNGANAYLDRQPYFQNMERFLIHETAVHFIDVFRFLFGDATNVYSELWTVNPAICGEDAGVVLFGFGDGLRVTFDGNRTLDHAAENKRLTMGEMLIEGSEASLSLDGEGQIKLRKFGENVSETIACDFNRDRFGGDCVRLLQNHVVSHILDGGPLENTASEYLENLKIEEAIYQSAKDGCRIEL